MNDRVNQFASKVLGFTLAINFARELSAMLRYSSLPNVQQRHLRFVVKGARGWLKTVD